MTLAPSLPLLIALVCGYLCGSIPFGLLFTRWAGLGDVRAIGSGNIGATNVLRTGNRKVAAATLLGDVLKGTVPVLLARHLGGEAVAMAAGAGAFVGHLFPVWLHFRGGKGVATYLGVLLGVAPVGVLVFAAVWLGAAKLFRFSSLAALAATVVVPLALWLLDRPHAALFTLGLTVVVWAKHHANIRRLLAGTEGRIGAKG